jgi:predicted permease
MRFYRSRRRIVDEDAVEELRLHLELLTDRYVAGGMTREEARAAANRQLGNVTRIREDLYEMNGWRWLDILSGDIRYGFRQLRRTPVFATVVITTIAIGVGATTGVFSLINGLLLRDLPVRDPQRLVTISSQAGVAQGRLSGGGWSYPMWDRFRERAQAFDGAFVWAPQRFSLGSGGEMKWAEGVVTTADFFDTLGVRMAMGRPLTVADERRGGALDGPVTVVSHAFWERELKGARNVIGTSLVIEGVWFSIAGVTAEGFGGVEVGRSFDVAITFGAEALIRVGAAIDQPNAFGLIPMLRLRPGQTLEHATNTLRDLQPEILGTGQVPPFLKEPFFVVPAAKGTSVVGPGMLGLRQHYERALQVVLLIVCVLHLIACTNIANLLLVRAETRRSELSVRMALGASRRRLLCQLVVESVTLGVAGGLGALLIANWTKNGLLALMTVVDDRVSLNLPIDWHVAAFGIGVTMTSVALFGAAPAFLASGAVHQRGSMGGPSRGLVVIQIALSFVLVVGAGLLLQTVSHLGAIPLGFDRDAVMLVTIDTKRASIAATTRLGLYEQLVSAVAAVNGVEYAAASTSIPLSGGYGRLRAGTTLTPPDSKVVTLFNFVSPKWFATYGTPLTYGRDFNEQDSSTAVPVVIINEALARALFADRDPVGERIITGAPNWPAQTVIGVVRDAVYHPIDTTAQSGSALRAPAPPTLYVPLSQSEGLTPPGMTRITIALRSTAAPPSTLIANVGARLQSTDPDVSFSFRPLADVVSGAFAEEQLLAKLSSAFGALALFLAAIGVYGLTSHTVTQRRTEIGIRIALGATRRSVAHLILRRIVILAALGIGSGIVLAAWELQVVSSFLFGVSQHDLATMIGGVLVMSAIALVAGWLPTWRAARVEPVEVLREN